MSTRNNDDRDMYRDDAGGYGNNQQRFTYEQQQGYANGTTGQYSSGMNGYQPQAGLGAEGGAGARSSYLAADSRERERERDRGQSAAAPHNGSRSRDAKSNKSLSMARRSAGNASGFSGQNGTSSGGGGGGGGSVAMTKAQYRLIYGDISENATSWAKSLRR
jgi:hypothetical protein